MIKPHRSVLWNPHPRLHVGEEITHPQVGQDLFIGSVSYFIIVLLTQLFVSWQRIPPGHSTGHARLGTIVPVMLGDLIELVAGIWQADSEIRDRSLLGESKMERRSRRFVAWICGGTIALLVLAGVLWWWFAERG